MLSSLGFDAKGSRGARANSKYVLEVPRGFSVHVFKAPSPPLPPQSNAGKVDFTSSRTAPSLPWKPTPYSRADTDRKVSFSRSDAPRLDQAADYERALDVSRSKSSKPYGIVPSAIPDTYIYERSISSASDLPGSPLSSSSSDTDSVDSVTPFSLDVSSIRASSSVETLEATAYFSHNRDALPAPAKSPYGSTRGPVIPISSRQISYSSRYAPADQDDDSDTVVSEDHGASRALTVQPSGASSAPPAPLAIRRNSDERSSRAPVSGPVPPTASRREQPQRSHSTSPTTYPTEVEANLRLPPGLQYSPPNGPQPVLHRANTSPTLLPSQRSSPEASKPPLVRALTNPEGEVAITAVKRTVRWTEDLVSPFPVPPSQRRKGWYNRRGDQLWTNDGRYKCVEPGQEYPPDLVGYPEPSAGWMNEDGTRIDLKHRLIPKPPLRSALKRPKDTTLSSSQGLASI